MILILIASILNILLVVLATWQWHDASVRGWDFILFMLIFVTPIVNLIALWVLRCKGNKESGQLEELKERIVKIESLVEKQD